MDEDAINSLRQVRDLLLRLHETSIRAITTMRETDVEEWSPSDVRDFLGELIAFKESEANACMKMAHELDRLGDYFEELKRAMDDEAK